MRRRAFISLLGAAATWPLTAFGQSAAIPTVGFLYAGSFSTEKGPLNAFRDALKQAGYIEGQNLKVEYRDAEGQYGRLPALAADLVSHRVDVIVAAGGIAPAKAAKASTTDIPIVFSSGVDPIKAGLVKSLNRPGGNVTGVSLIFSELSPKLLGILHQLVPNTPLVGALVNPTYPGVDLQIRELQEAAEAAKQPIYIEKADTELAINKAFDKDKPELPLEGVDVTKAVPELTVECISVLKNEGWTSALDVIVDTNASIGDVRHRICPSAS